jgi:hypothetical protein
MIAVSGAGGAIKMQEFGRSPPGNEKMHSYKM